MKCLSKRNWVDFADRDVKIILKNGEIQTAVFQGMSKGKKRLYAIQDGQPISWELSCVDSLFIL